MSDLSKDIYEWLSTIEGYSFSEIKPVNSDASFRSYFRVFDDDKGPFIVMDSDPNLENNDKFIGITNLLKQISMPIPTIHQINDSGRFFLISDLGPKSLFDHRHEKVFQGFYTKAIELLVLMQINYGLKLKILKPPILLLSVMLLQNLC